MLGLVLCVSCWARTAAAVGARFDRAASAASLRSAFRTRSNSSDKESRAGAAMRALLTDARSQLSHELYRGMRAPLNQAGYEATLGPTGTAAFVLRYINSLGLEVNDTEAFKGFLTYYDGDCHKKSFAELTREIDRDEFRSSCHGSWVKPSSAVAPKSSVTLTELQALQAKEVMLERVAGYAASFRSNEANNDKMASAQTFAHALIDELGGEVVDEKRFVNFVERFVSRSGLGLKPLESLLEHLREESEANDPFVTLPSLLSQSVTLVEAAEPHAGDQGGPIASVGTTVPLNQAGYLSVVNLHSDEEMQAYVERTAAQESLQINDVMHLKKFVPWYSGRCAVQSHQALVAELHSLTTRSAACGGGWVAPLTDTTARDSLLTLPAVFEHLVRKPIAALQGLL